ncbi:hypothetical protein [Variovorax sp. E3]|nr:hypothetical protein [Variovorax sp. E3]
MLQLDVRELVRGTASPEVTMLQLDVRELVRGTASPEVGSPRFQCNK